MTENLVGQWDGAEHNKPRGQTATATIPDKHNCKNLKGLSVVMQPDQGPQKR
jgi:hypothetical protein